MNYRPILEEYGKIVAEHAYGHGGFGDITIVARAHQLSRRIKTETPELVEGMEPTLDRIAEIESMRLDTGKVCETTLKQVDMRAVSGDIPKLYL